jgi:two-component system chemotaxis response regulator CheB
VPGPQQVWELAYSYCGRVLLGWRMASTARRDIVVIGASLGGVEALKQVVSNLPPELAAFVAIVLHMGANRSLMPELLSAAGPHLVEHAKNGDIIRPGRLVVAPPDHHLLFRGEQLQLSRGPKEHHTRPAIDPLFRSAALEHGPRVIGVVLTGNLDDGTAGLQAIKQARGLAVVQDPQTADAPSMPLSAMQYVDVDHCVPLQRIGSVLTELIGQTAPAPIVTLPELELEQASLRGKVNMMEELEAIGSPAALTCPECRGALWELKDARPPRFRCHTGHAFTLRTLEHSMNESKEDALWTAARALEQRAALGRRVANELRDWDPRAAANEDSRAAADEAHATQLRQLIEKEA